jgi:hypothetical protein
MLATSVDASQRMGFALGLWVQRLRAGVLAAAS